MASYNRVVMIGNLTRDPDYKQLSSGQAVCRLGLATNRQFKNRQTGTMVQEVCYVDIDVWGAQAESCRQYLLKGRPVLVEGRLKFDTWEDQNGQTRSKHSIVADRIVFLGAGSEAQDAGSRSFETTDQAQEPQSELERELLGQIDQIKKRTQAPKKEARKTNEMQQDEFSHDVAVAKTGEINFKDEPPFEDDLPF